MAINQASPLLLTVANLRSLPLHQPFYRFARFEHTFGSLAPISAPRFIRTILFCFGIAFASFSRFRQLHESAAATTTTKTLKFTNINWLTHNFLWPIARCMVASDWLVFVNIRCVWWRESRGSWEFCRASAQAWHRFRPQTRRLRECDKDRARCYVILCEWHVSCTYIRCWVPLVLRRVARNCGVLTLARFISPFLSPAMCPSMWCTSAMPKPTRPRTRETATTPTTSTEYYYTKADLKMAPYFEILDFTFWIRYYNLEMSFFLIEDTVSLYYT